MPMLYIMGVFGIILGIAAIHDAIYNRRRKNLCDIDNEKYRLMIYYRYGIKD